MALLKLIVGQKFQNTKVNEVYRIVSLNNISVTMEYENKDFAEKGKMNRPISFIEIQVKRGRWSEIKN